MLYLLTYTVTVTAKDAADTILPACSACDHATRSPTVEQSGPGGAAAEERESRV